MTNISNPLGGGKTLDFKTFENLAKNKAIDNKSTVHLATGSGGRVIVGLEAKSPIGGKKIQLLGKPLEDLSKVSDAQRSGILATRAFKQALVQRYGETIANALDQHLLKSGEPKILTAEDLRKNLKVAAAIVRILKASPDSEKTTQTTAKRNHTLSNSSSRRNQDGSPVAPSAPPRSRASSTTSEDSADVFFRDREPPPAYRSTEDLRPSAPPKSPTLSAKHVHEVDQAGNQWHHSPLYLKADDVLELAGESASLPEDPEKAKAAQRPRTQALSQDELEASLDEVIKKLNDQKNDLGKI
jgi:hypothetical protein